MMTPVLVNTSMAANEAEEFKALMASLEAPLADYEHASQTDKVSAIEYVRAFRKKSHRKTSRLYRWPSVTWQPSVFDFDVKPVDQTKTDEQTAWDSYKRPKRLSSNAILRKAMYKLLAQHEQKWLRRDRNLREAIVDLSLRYLETVFDEVQHLRRKVAAQPRVPSNWESVLDVVEQHVPEHIYERVRRRFLDLNNRLPFNKDKDEIAVLPGEVTESVLPNDVNDDVK